LIQGIKIPITKIPSNGAKLTAPTDIDSCKTLPNFSTIDTKITDTTPKKRTVDLITSAVCFSDSGREMKGFTKSSRITEMGWKAKIIYNSIITNI
jgi:hypothetical protein